ncbi:DUF3152 domain-containing protein [Streptomyces sp. NPDC032940]|uniref:DUF3152 domain-containing protein n=1 Tax=Streptomyces sp. NPDC032940 TaxID=3155366 RepID=UPI0033FFD1E1
MGRHSRRGPAPKSDHADAPAAAREDRSARPGRRRVPGPPAEGMPGPAPRGAVPGGGQGYAVPRLPDGTPAEGFPGVQGGTPAHGVPRFPDATPAHGVARFPDGTPAQGVPRVQGGMRQAQGFPGFPDGTPAHGSPRIGGGTPARGVPRFPDGTPAHGMPQVRGGHPEQREPGGGWGEPGGRSGAAYGAPAGSPPGVSTPGVPFPRQRQAPAEGPRPDYLDAFGEDDDDVFSARTRRRTPVPGQAPDPYGSVADRSSGDGPGAPVDDTAPTGEPAPAKGGKGRTFTGIAAAAVTTVLAVVVAGQVADGQDGEGAASSRSATDQARDARDPASRADGRPTPSASGGAAAPLTYEQAMAKTYPLGAGYKGSGKFEAIPGFDKAPGTGQKYTYRVDVEQGLGLDGALFAQAVQKTLNDNRSWAHNGARTFERIHSGEPDFVITLASPGTTADWCAKSGLDTTEDNVSCDSAATERVMINAYRWAQGAEPFGDQIYAYRQMLINHEVGHRIGYNHVSCDKDGELAPVMQQQTKFVDHDGIDCRPNAWAYPNG